MHNIWDLFKDKKRQWSYKNDFNDFEARSTVHMKYFKVKMTGVCYLQVTWNLEVKEHPSKFHRGVKRVEYYE